MTPRWVDPRWSTPVSASLAFPWEYYSSWQSLPVARWADRGNRRTIISLSLLIWSVTTLLCGFASSFWHLLAARIGVGAGEGGANPPSQSLISDYFPPRQTRRRVGDLYFRIHDRHLGRNHHWRLRHCALWTAGRIPRGGYSRPPARSRHLVAPVGASAVSSTGSRTHP